jgi:uncharacterized membrane protein
MSIKKSAQRKLTDQQRIEFTKQIEYFYEVAHADLKKVAVFSFIKGIATGLGVFLGGTIVAALLLWAASQLDRLPFVGNISKATEQSVNQTKNN